MSLQAKPITGLCCVGHLIGILGSVCICEASGLDNDKLPASSGQYCKWMQSEVAEDKQAAAINHELNVQRSQCLVSRKHAQQSIWSRTQHRFLSS